VKQNSKDKTQVQFLKLGKLSSLIKFKHITALNLNILEKKKKIALFIEFN
jgi:hypothetical protein